MPRKVARADSETRSSNLRTTRIGEPEARNIRHFKGHASRFEEASPAAADSIEMVTMPRVLMNSSMWVESSTIPSAAAASDSAVERIRKDLLFLLPRERPINRRKIKNPFKKNPGKQAAGFSISSRRISLLYKH